MSLHKLTAGSGYDYLTRQVAALDSTEKGRTSLSSYYSEKGEAPGSWVGSGLTGIAGLDAGDVVTAEQMKALFAYGFHPLAEQRVAALELSASVGELHSAQRLGRPFVVFEGDVPQFQIDIARRLGEMNVAAGSPADAATSIGDTARIRTEVARQYFLREHGRQPDDAREVAATVAKHSRPKTTAVAGFDLSFSPVKSVSTLWAIAPPSIAAKIELAHDLAIKDAVAFIEKHALFTRKGAQGVQQVDVTGLVGTAFTHRDSRAGDPDLHTHLAVANKVQTLDGDWSAIDGRVLFKATVTASETYNTALERHLVESLGVRFAERPGTDPHKRPIREIVGVDPELNTRWSSRRASIDIRRAVLATTFQRDHGRPPTPVEAIQLAQQATLETRDAKHEPRSLDDQRATWRAEAVEILGGENQVNRMVAGALARPESCGERVTSQWVTRRAEQVVAQVSVRRATWQVWHLRAEAQRQVRSADVRADRVEDLVTWIVDTAIEQCVSLATDRDLITDPDKLRRKDGTSVFHVAGSDVFTNRMVLDAELRLTESAGRVDGRIVPAEVIDLALLESTANGAELNTGQVALVRGMATSGARVQLGIAAAGTGKTTAMSVLTRAWEESGGNVVGLAPSAAAASILSGQTRAVSDTLAKLVHHIDQGTRSALLNAIGPGTLVLIDEAGMADTLSLDTAVAFILDRGASVRLIGDDQQLAAIGAGGVLRDIDHQHGTLRLSELMRFADPAEGAASLALRDGQTEGLGHYLDHGRVHVGDLSTETDAVFDAWTTDTEAGLASIMLAPTRDLVAELNARARTARLAGSSASASSSSPRNEMSVGSAVRLSDGNQASVGETIITRRNDRLLRLSATDWVKNGDRWTVTAVQEGRLAVRHAESNLRIVLPAEYVDAHAELGYASTVHTAQGISTDTMHGLVTGDETRQQFYTMMTRGRHANHVYLVVTSDGDAHNLIRPETIHPLTATDVLERILGRDGSPRSATTIARDFAAPSTLLPQAAARYTEAVYTESESLIGASRVEELVRTAEELAPGICDEPAWLTLRAHLIVIDADGRDAAKDLRNAVADRPLDGVKDRAAILDWRLDPTTTRGAHAGPLPWLPGIPALLISDPQRSPYLHQRAQRVEDLAASVRNDATISADIPQWARQGGARPAANVLADVAVWRAATGVDTTDRRPTGGPQVQKAHASHQRRLNERLHSGRASALSEWGPLIDVATPRRDSFTPLLAARLAAISRSGVDAAALFRNAASDGPLPDDHAAAALWWRISGHLSPIVTTQATGHDHALPVDGAALLIDVLGEEPAASMTASPWWPTVVASIDQATRRGWAVTDLLDLASTTDVNDVDPAQALVWRIAIVTDPPPESDPYDENPPPEDMYDNTVRDVSAPAHVKEPADLAAAAFQRRLLGPLEPSDHDITRMLDHAHQWDHSPVTGDRILRINTLTAEFFEANLRGSWAQIHLLERLGLDLAADERFRPGYAPPGWTNLINHLHHHGITDTEMLAAGVATTASTGALIDRFRDRAMLPVISGGDVLGFVGRRHPDTIDDTRGGPKYHNTADTIVFHKGSQLYGLADTHMGEGSIPVLVEGPIDAIAITLATAGAFVGVAPLGTSMTHDQATQLAGLDASPIIATDGDLAGRIAAERDYWLLTPHLTDPRYARFDTGEDPASVLENGGRANLLLRLQQARPLADTLIEERLTNIVTAPEQATAIARIIAARPPGDWDQAIDNCARADSSGRVQMRQAVATAAVDFNHDRGSFSNDGLAGASDVRTRLEQADSATAGERWANLARHLDPRLLGQQDWPATATMLQQVHDAGYDLHILTRQFLDEALLNESPAQDLRYRLVGYLPEEMPTIKTNTAASRDRAGRANSSLYEREPRPRTGGVGPSR
ncbi:MobF family relaxase [Aeromicrobium sp.]|uniref:MobF family relaxase n=1 Tax=Aeromicrobium sp. TaxID=1871063 RepID=UPI0019BA4A6D|nr:MobF family relaxase [Aeromicrobium sp.]MBC7633265.1 relaxase domain-containing protein [Aeromicrobium sp.]